MRAAAAPGGGANSTAVISPVDGSRSRILARWRNASRPTIARTPSSGPVHSVTERQGLQRTSRPPGSGSIVSKRGPVDE